jgi:hypothetical protein
VGTLVNIIRFHHFQFIQANWSGSKNIAKFIAPREHLRDKINGGRASNFRERSQNFKVTQSEARKIHGHDFI